MLKGTDFEKAIEAYYKSLGCEVDRAEASLMRRGKKVWTKSHDFFKRIDLMVICPKNKRTLWIQATVPSGVSERKKKVSEFPWLPGQMVFIYESRSQRSAVDKRKWEHWIRVHKFTVSTGEWKELKPIRLPI